MALPLTPSPILLDAEPLLSEQVGNIVIRKDQVITPQMLRDNMEARNRTAPEGEFMHVASIPTIVVEKWQREGFDIMRPGVSAREIVRRLKAEGLEAFLTTNKRV